MPYSRQCPAPGNRDGASRQEEMTVVARYPDSTKTSLEQRLRARARDRWPQIASLQIRHRGTLSGWSRKFVGGCHAASGRGLS